MADGRIANRARAAAERVTAGRRGGALGAARSLYERLGRREQAEHPPAAGDAELTRLRAELQQELARLAERRA